MDKFDNNVSDMLQSDKDESSKVMYYLPITPDWLASFVLSLMFDCKGSFRGIQRAAHSLLDFNLTHDFINAACRKAKDKAAELNLKYDLSSIVDAALDELFHLGQPVLGGIDLRSLYCFNLRKEDDRDGDTWMLNLNKCKSSGLNPERIIADGGIGIAYAVPKVFKNTKLERDIFHNIKDMNDMRRFIYNRSRSFTTAVENIKKRIVKPRNKNNKALKSLLRRIEKEKKQYENLFETISTLVEWMIVDVLRKVGYSPEVRYELYDFIVDELHKLELVHPHRIRKVRLMLQKNKSKILGFLQTLDDKFTTIAQEFGCDNDIIWRICNMQKYNKAEKKYLRNQLCMYLRLGSNFPKIEQAVIKTIDSTETSSSMIENFNSRLSGYFFLRKNIENKYLGLLQFYLNHNKFVRSERDFRKKKSPVNIMTGKEHPHWLEMLGFCHFKQAA